MLNQKAHELLRCKAMKHFGGQCRAYVIRGLDVCVAHSLVQSGGPGSGHPVAYPSRQPCKCQAYQWPHRRGSGPCRWPDPPAMQCLTPAGTRRSPLARAAQRAEFARARRGSTAQPIFPKRLATIKDAEPKAFCTAVTGPPLRRSPRY